MSASSTDAVSDAGAPVEPGDGGDPALRDGVPAGDVVIEKVTVALAPTEAVTDGVVEKEKVAEMDAELDAVAHAVARSVAVALVELVAEPDAELTPDSDDVGVMVGDADVLPEVVGDAALDADSSALRDGDSVGDDVAEFKVEAVTPTCPVQLPVSDTVPESVSVAVAFDETERDCVTLTVAENARGERESDVEPECVRDPSGVTELVFVADAEPEEEADGVSVTVGAADGNALSEHVVERVCASCVGDTVAVAPTERVRFDVVDTVEHDDADAGAALGSSLGATTEGDDVTHADGVQPRTKGSVVVVIVMELSAARCGANAAGVTAKHSDGTARDMVMCIVPHITMAARMIAATEKQSTRVRTAYTYLPRGAACGRATTSPRASYRHGQHIGTSTLSWSHSVIG